MQMIKHRSVCDYSFIQTCASKKYGLKKVQLNEIDENFEANVTMKVIIIFRAKCTANNTWSYSVPYPCMKPCLANSIITTHKYPYLTWDSL